MGFKESIEIFNSPEEIYQAMEESIVEMRGKPMVLDIEKLREDMDMLVHNTLFNKDDDVRLECRVMIKYLAEGVQVKLASIQGLYEAMGKGEITGFSVPAINIRGLTYETARAVFRSALKASVGAFIFEIAKSEIGYTNQSPSEYSAIVLAAAIKEGFTGPVFMQGDHFQVNLKEYAKDSEKEVFALKDLIQEAVGAGFYNIDIDASTTVDLHRSTTKEQQQPNIDVTVELTKYIRSIEPMSITVSIGGEIGEVGSKNSTEEELRAFMDGYLEKMGTEMKGISKISIQTGTAHGGVVLPDGSIAEVSVDFDTIEKLTKVSREAYGLSGVVQHGASTLPDDSFHLFPERGASEVHLATGFQNMIYDSANFPSDLKGDINRYLLMKHATERKPSDTEEQFIYKTRKKGFGPFKERIATLPRDKREAIGRELEERFDMLFSSLKVQNTAEAVGNYIK